MKYNSKDDSTYATRINQLITGSTNSDSNIFNGRVISPDNMTEATSTKDKKSKKNKKNKKLIDGKSKEGAVDDDRHDFEITDNVLLPKVKNNK